MYFKQKFLKRATWGILILWTLLILLISAVFIRDNYTYANTLAKNEAVVSVKKDIAYRVWGASHGGVYVPITKKTPPNPYLSHIPNRDVTTSANQKLTLMNPAYMLSQMTKDYSELYGTKGHITSRVLMNPKNKPDSWEEESLKVVEVTNKPIFAKKYIDGEEYFRYLYPLETKKSCLKCHAFQGYKVGDIRGAVSVSIPMNKYYKDAFSYSLTGSSMMFFIWLLGVFAILFSSKKAKKILEEKIKDYEQHIFSLVSIIEKRDSYTAGHTQRVAKYSSLIAKDMGLSKNKVDDLYRACMLHDIGKISTPDSILLKPGKLTDLEYKIIKDHVVVGYELLKEVDIYSDIAEIVRYHHERYDGNGYPLGLKGDEIPILSQIMTVADAFDAMTTNRIYKARKEVNEAIEELESLAGIQFNKGIVNSAVLVLKDIDVDEEIKQRPISTVEQERFSYFYKDQVTTCYNRDYLEFVLAYNHKDKFNVCCAYGVYLHQFSQYNKKYGWNKGDEILEKISTALIKIGKNNLVFRIYGDDFVVLSKQYFDIEIHLEELNTILDYSDIEMTYKYIDMKKFGIKYIHDLEELL